MKRSYFECKKCNAIYIKTRKSDQHCTCVCGCDKFISSKKRINGYVPIMRNQDLQYDLEMLTEDLADFVLSRVNKREQACAFAHAALNLIDLNRREAVIILDQHFSKVSTKNKYRWLNVPDE